MTVLYYVREAPGGVLVAHVVGAFAAGRVVTVCGGDWARYSTSDSDLLHVGRPHGTELCRECAEQLRAAREAARLPSGPGAPDTAANRKSNGGGG